MAFAIVMYFMVSSWYETNEAFEKGEFSFLSGITMSLWGFLFGVLLEWRGLTKLIKGQINVNWLLAPAIVLTILTFIPTQYWLGWFGLQEPFFIEMFYIPKTQAVLDVASGILLVRSISQH